jgi:hypothetical protein
LTYIKICTKSGRFAEDKIHFGERKRIKLNLAPGPNCGRGLVSTMGRLLCWPKRGRALGHPRPVTVAAWGVASLRRRRTGALQRGTAAALRRRRRRTTRRRESGCGGTALCAARWLSRRGSEGPHRHSSDEAEEDGELAAAVDGAPAATGWRRAAAASARARWQRHGSRRRQLRTTGDCTRSS